jgi:hypothetical protein
LGKAKVATDDRIVSKVEIFESLVPGRSCEITEETGL